MPSSTDESVKTFADGYDAALARYRAKVALGVIAEPDAFAVFLTDLGYAMDRARRIEAMRHA